MNIETATITAKYINPPKTPKGPGSIRDADGHYWKAWPDLLAKVKQGARIEVEYERGEYMGKETRTIKKIVGESASVPMMKATVSAPTAEAFLAQGYTEKDKLIYVECILKALLGNPAIDPSRVTAQDVANMTKIGLSAWAIAFGR